jgi:hypothetical protein
MTKQRLEGDKIVTTLWKWNIELRCWELMS